MVSQREQKSHIQEGRVIPSLGHGDMPETNEYRYGKEHPLAKQHYTQANTFSQKCRQKLERGKRL